MEKKRLDYIDVAKGILVLLMVLHHVSYWVVDYCNVHTCFTESIHNLRWYIYGSYFMTAFFVITGLCSNFDKEIKQFVTGNCVSLLLPMFIMGHGHISWFLACMFTSKMIYWALLRLSHSRYFIGSISILLSMLGCLVHKDNTLDLWAWQHALVVMPFIFMGHQFNAVFSNQSYCLTGSVLFVILTIILLLCDFSPFYFEFGYHIELLTYPLFLFFAIIGSCFIIYLSTLFHGVPLLGFFGRYSIVVYLLHSYFLPPIALRVAPFIEQANGEFWISSALYLFIFTSTALLCYIACWMFQYKWLSWIIGRFDFQNLKK